LVISADRIKSSVNAKSAARLHQLPVNGMPAQTGMPSPLSNREPESFEALLRHNYMGYCTHPIPRPHRFSVFPDARQKRTVTKPLGAEIQYTDSGIVLACMATLSERMPTAHFLTGRRLTDDTR
jgi:hypothetical protein